MRVQLISFWEFFGFFSICNEESQQECWFFYNKHQGREIAEVAKLVCSDKENVAQFIKYIEESELPEQSDSKFLYFKNKEAFTIQYLVRKSAVATANGAGLVKVGANKFQPHTFFVLTPEKDDRFPSVLIGVCNEHNRHLTFVVYAKDQAGAVLDRMIWETPETMKYYRKIVEECSLPLTSPNRYGVVIGEPMSLVLHFGIGEARRQRSATD